MARKIGKDRRYIQNLSRAINKIDESIAKSVNVASYEIANVKMGINDLTFSKNGRDVKVSYKDIPTLSRADQASLWNKLAFERTKTREKVALEQLKEKGKISTQFKRSLKQVDDPLLENIREFEKMTENNAPSAIMSEFENFDFRDIEDDIDDFFQTDDGNGLTGSDKQFDFFHGNGFSQLNNFTINTYRVLNS